MQNFNFNNPYNRQDFRQFVEKFLPDDFTPVEQAISYQGNYTQRVVKLGESKSLELEVFEVTHTSTRDARVGLSHEAFRLMHKRSSHNRALIAFVPSDGSKQWRFSLLHFDLEVKDNSARLSKIYSNPRRYSFLLGEDEKVKTPQQYLIGEGKVKARKRQGKEYTAWEDLCYRFSVEVLSKDFFDNYKTHYQAFCTYLMDTPSYYTAIFNKEDKAIRDFCKKLLGRIVFLYFLQKKGWLGASDENYTDGDKNFLYNFFKKSRKTDVFYSEYLQRLFFETLNKKRENDNFQMPDGETVKIPFLNGGLFENDFSTDKIINFPAEKFSELFEFFDQYNFTVYEDDPHDHTVAVDPEMLGHIFENLLEDNKDKGAFYTPKEIVHYMCRESLKEYLLSEPKFSQDSQDFQDFQTVVQQLFSNSLVNLELKIGDSQNLNKIVVQTIIEKLDEVKICDPAIGSGAFPMGLLLEIFNAKQLLQSLLNEGEKTQSPADIKLQIIQNSIYGVDIEKGAVDIARLRFWLSLIIDEERPRALPNLDYKIMQGNSLIEAFGDVELSDLMQDATPENNHSLPGAQLQMFEEATQTLLSFEEKGELKAMMSAYFDYDESKNNKFDSKQALKQAIDSFVENRLIAKFEAEANKVFEETQRLNSDILANIPNATDPKGIVDKKSKNTEKLKKLLDKEVKKLGALNANLSKLKEMQRNPDSEKPFFLWHTWFKEVFDNGGFDIVIGNPPYVSTKGVSAEDKKLFEQAFGFADDTYNHFFFKGFNLLKQNGVITYIIPKTFWTTQTKRNLRALLLSKNINYIFDTANPFQAAMVDTCIISAKNCKQENNQILFLDGKESLVEPQQYTINQNIYLNTQNFVIFKPTLENLKIYELYGEKVKDLYNQWWDKIKTSADIAKNSDILEEYRKNLKPGDIALLGCLTEGGQGLATANNGKYIAVRKSTKWAKNILESRPKKLAEAIRQKNIQLAKMVNFGNTTDFLASLSEKEIAELFDRLKEQYGRDIFGQGYIYRLIDDSEIADVDMLTEDEKKNGICETKNYYVPYDKGDKDGNRWYLETPFAIAWSKKNVGFLKTNSGKKGEGMPVVRNPQFYFKEGFCWSDINTTFLKCRKKQKSINDVKSMSLYSLTDIVPEYYIICLINSSFMSYYVDDFVNNTQTFQINDARQIPIIIPTEQQLREFENLFNTAIGTKKNQSPNDAQLAEIQEKLDEMIEELYGRTHLNF